jgi:hypothetical protein
MSRSSRPPLFTGLDDAVLALADDDPTKRNAIRQREREIAARRARGPGDNERTAQRAPGHRKRSALNLPLRIADTGMRPTTFEGFRMVMLARQRQVVSLKDKRARDSVSAAALAHQLNLLPATVRRWTGRLAKELEQERVARLTPIERRREKRIQELHKRRAQLARKGYRV